MIVGFLYSVESEEEELSELLLEVELLSSSLWRENLS
jgi:hypothetical protein